MSNKVYREDITVSKVIELYKKHPSAKQISKILGCSPATVNRRLEEAIAKGLISDKDLRKPGRPKNKTASISTAPQTKRHCPICGKPLKSSRLYTCSRDCRLKLKLQKDFKTSIPYEKLVTKYRF